MPLNIMGLGEILANGFGNGVYTPITPQRFCSRFWNTPRHSYDTYLVTLHMLLLT